MWVQWIMNSWLEDEIDEGTVSIPSAQLRIFLICSSYREAGSPLMDSKEARLHWLMNKWMSTNHL